MMKDTICVAVGLVGGFFTAIFGGWDSALVTLVVFMAIDFFTGIITAMMKKSKHTESGGLSSKAGWFGLAKKVCTLMLIVVAVRMDILLNTNYIRDAVCISFCLNELLSIVENTSLMGIPYPPAIKKQSMFCKRKSAERKKPPTRRKSNMTILRPDATTTFGGVTVNEYLLTKHNPNHIDMPSVSMEGKVIGVTVHNTDWISVASGTTPAEQYTRATVNNNMKDVRVHYYVDNVCAWQNLPHSLSGWHAADGSGNGNRRTIAIECIMSSAYNSVDKKSEDNAAKLAAALLKQYGLDINHLYTHTHWLNVRDGRNGTVDQLNTMYNRYKMCPAYILPHWAEFKKKVQSYLNAGSASTTPILATKQLYRARKSWADAKSQLGAYSSLENAKKVCKIGYSVFDNSGRVVYTVAEKTYAKGTKITLNNATLYASSTAKTGTKKSGTFYLYDGQVVKGRMRITNSAANCGKTPVGNYVTGWVNQKDI